MSVRRTAVATIGRRSFLAVVAATILGVNPGCANRPRDVASRLQAAIPHAGEPVQRPVGEVLVGRWERRRPPIPDTIDVLEFARDGSVVLTFATSGGPRRHVGRWASIPYCGHDLGLEPKRYAILRDCVELYFDADPDGARAAPVKPMGRGTPAIREDPAPGTYRLRLWHGRLFEDEIACRWIDNPGFQAVFESHVDDPGWASFAPAVTGTEAPRSVNR